MNNLQKKRSNKCGFTLVELLVTIFTLSIMTLGLVQFSSSTFKVAYNHSLQVQKADQTRLASELITGEISKSVYIFPSDQTISLSWDTGSTTINTSNAIAFLEPSPVDSDPPNYIFKAYFLKSENDAASLYQFIADSEENWNENTFPADTFSSNDGNVALVATDIDLSSSQLSYIMNYSNGITDGILKGGISAVTPENSNALIKGINWSFKIDNESAEQIRIGGISHNVPRFIQ